MAGKTNTVPSISLEWCGPLLPRSAKFTEPQDFLCEAFNSLIGTVSKTSGQIQLITDVLFGLNSVFKKFRHGILKNQ